MLQIESIPIENLKPAPYNPRKMPDEQMQMLMKGIEEFGIVQPIIVNEQTGHIVGGHQRVEAAQRVGLKTVPVVFVDLDEQREKTLNIGLNKIHGEWDFPSLTALLDELQAGGADMQLTGFTDDELEQMMTWEPEPEATAGLTDPDDVPEPPAEPITKPGDLWILGRHRLLCGDSTIIAEVERLMDGKKADMVFTDPPYELETKGGGLLKESTAMRDIAKLGIDKFDPSLLMRQSETSVFFCNKPLIPAYIKLASVWGCSWDLAVYHKQNTTPNYGGHLMTDIEYIFIVGKQSPIPGQEKDLYSKLYSGNKDGDNVVAWSKPVALCEKFILLYAESGRIVLDLFGGSGSTLIAAEKTGRTAYLMELDPRYASVIIKRWEQFTGQTAALEA